jgi:acyl dehydratase
VSAAVEVTSPADLVGTDFGPHDVVVEAGLLQLFTKVVGLSDPLHHDPRAAAAAGNPGLLVPPTYLFGLERRHPEVPRIIGRLGIDIGSVLHGEQTFRYHAPAYSGDVLTFRPRFADYYEKKGGALRFLVRDTTVDRAGEPVAELRNVLVVRAAGSPA